MAGTESLATRFDHWEFVLAGGTFEAALAALEEIVERLDDGRLSLEDSLRCYEFGVLIGRRCEKMLDEAELRISRLETEVAESDLDDQVDEPAY
ncbi:MAG TPA: exodeoxyribonuclease VII small subunit [Thermomicrobiales bacterium]|jgi:exodeoxyribonuclease VII small subunit